MISKMFCTKIRTALVISFKPLKVPLQTYKNYQEVKELDFGKKAFLQSLSIGVQVFKNSCYIQQITGVEFNVNKN